MQQVWFVHNKTVWKPAERVRAFEIGKRKLPLAFRKGNPNENPDFAGERLLTNHIAVRPSVDATRASYALLSDGASGSSSEGSVGADSGAGAGRLEGTRRLTTVASPIVAAHGSNPSSIADPFAASNAAFAASLWGTSCAFEVALAAALSLLSRADLSFALLFVTSIDFSKSATASRALAAASMCTDFVSSK